MPDQEILLKVEGMTCVNCATGISKSLKNVGFKDADANFMDGEVSFTLVEGKKPQDAIEKIESLGYSVISSDIETKGRLSAIEKKFIFSLIFTVPLFMHMFVPHDWFLNNPIVQIALCLPVYITGFMHFGKSAWGSVKAGYANMDVLIFMGSTAAFLYSIVGTILHWGAHEVHNYMFFETAATIITLVLLGNVLEHRSIRQTALNIGELTKMQKTTARIVMRVGSTEKIFETEAKNVKPGDELQVNEGDYVPTDGKIISGICTVDESALTGESMPVEKNPGCMVYSGTAIISGNVRVLAEVASKDSTLQKVIDLVKTARKDQPQIQKLGDKVSSIFVPAVLIIAVVTFVLAYRVFDIGLTQALMNAVAVLVISCPCAMGLATPTAIVAGVGRAAKNGILIKGGSTLERYAGATTIIFDKTGTLTTGNFEIELTENSIGERAFALILALELHSSHPIAKAIVSHWQDKTPEILHDIQEIKGEGISGTTSDGEAVFCGKIADADEKADIWLTIGGQIATGLRIKDKIKPGAKSMLDTFKSEGFKTIILSGDSKAKVLATAQELGVGEAHFRMSPESKLRFIESLAAKEMVVMVGDGINDGPALSRAQVGISPRSASALALDSARVVIMHPDEMEALAQSFKISKHTYMTIKQNLFWAFFYNVVAIPLAAMGYLSPMIAALTMAFSDVVVIGNSLRLKIKRLS